MFLFLKEILYNISRGSWKLEKVHSNQNDEMTKEIIKILQRKKLILTFRRDEEMYYTIHDHILDEEVDEDVFIEFNSTGQRLYQDKVLELGLYEMLKFGKDNLLTLERSLNLDYLIMLEDYLLDSEIIHNDNLLFRRTILSNFKKYLNKIQVKNLEKEDILVDFCIENNLFNSYTDYHVTEEKCLISDVEYDYILEELKNCGFVDTHFNYVVNNFKLINQSLELIIDVRQQLEEKLKLYLGHAKIRVSIEIEFGWADDIQKWNNDFHQLLYYRQVSPIIFISLAEKDNYNLPFCEEVLLDNEVKGKYMLKKDEDNGYIRVLII